MDAELLRLGSKKETTFADEVDVPGAGGVDTSGKSGSTLYVADTLGSILIESVRITFRIFDNSERACRTYQLPPIDR
jgi:hypothetical protein